MSNPSRVNRSRPKRMIFCNHSESNLIEEEKTDQILELPAAPQETHVAASSILEQENQYLRKLCHKQGERLQNMVDTVSILEAGVHRVCNQLNIPFDDHSGHTERFSRILDEISILKKCYFSSLGLAMKLSMDDSVEEHPKSLEKSSMRKRFSFPSIKKEKQTAPSTLMQKSLSTNLFVSELYESIPRDKPWGEWSIWLANNMQNDNAAHSN